MPLRMLRSSPHLPTTLVMALGLLLAAPLPAADLPDWKQALQPADASWRQTEQRFTFNNGTEPQTLDPGLMTGVPESRIGLALFEGLVGLHPETLAPVPGLAERWERSPDGLRWVFHLRETTWSDGRPLTSADVVGSWRRVLTPATGSEYVYQLFPVAGAEAFFRGETHDDAAWATVGIEAPDDHTVVVQLANPTPYFLDLVAFHTLFPVPLHSIAAHGAAWTRPEHMVCNGPFRLIEHQPRNRIVLQRNPRYWDADFVKLDEIVVRPYEDLETGLKLFRQGELQWQPSVPAGRVDELMHDPDYYITPYLGTYFYRFNTTKPPLDDPQVRQALSLAVDREVITRHILKAGQQPAATLCPPGCAGYQPIDLPLQDLDRAKELWSKTPYGRGERELPPIELMYNTSESHKLIAENIATQWENALGVQVQLRNLEWKVYLDKMTALDYQIMRSSWIGDYNDPNTFFDMFVTGGGNNRTGWSDPAYDALVDQAAATSDLDQRLALFQQMERLLLEQGQPIMPIYFYVNQGLLSERVSGWYGNIRDQHPYQYIYLVD